MPILDQQQVREKIVGCLLGGAVGDALGWPMEFMSEDDCIGHFVPVVAEVDVGSADTRINDTHKDFVGPRSVHLDELNLQ